MEINFWKPRFEIKNSLIIVVPKEAIAFWNDNTFRSDKKISDENWCIMLLDITRTFYKTNIIKLEVSQNVFDLVNQTEKAILSEKLHIRC